jgi:hypothetical protein
MALLLANQAVIAQGAPGQARPAIENVPFFDTSRKPERPDLTVWLGDVCDFASFGRYRQEPGFALTVQPTIDTAHEYLALTANLSGEVRFLEGNHDARIHTAMVDNVQAAAGVRRADEDEDQSSTAGERR